MSRGQPVRIRNPHAVRPWQHVLEPLSGYLRLAEALAGEDGARFAEGWNFGPADDDARPVQWVVEQMLARWNGDLRWEHDARPQPHEAMYLKLDCSKARTRLQWRPRWSLEVALESIIDWQKAYLARADMRAKTLEQIAAFESLAPA
jgi:CDP-glucose 4,6-dehydratase